MTGYNWPLMVRSSVSGASILRLVDLKATRGIDRSTTIRPTHLPKPAQQHALSSILAIYRPLMRPLRACERTSDRCTVEYRVAPAFAGTDLGHERWVAIEGATVRDAKGEPTHLLGITRDVSERKQVERSLAERDLQLALASKYALVGTFTFDTASEKMEVSTGYAAIHGFPRTHSEIRRDDWRAGVHPDDLPCVEARFREAIAARRCEHFCEYRIVARGGEVRGSIREAS